MPKIVDHAERRAELADVTARQIAAVGIERLRLRDVAKLGGWTTGTVSHYFADKRQLLLATFRSQTETARRRLADAIRDGADQLEAIVESTLPLDEARMLTWQVWLAFWGAAVGDPELGDEQRARYQGFRDACETAVRARQDGGHFRADLDPAHEARRLVALIDGIAVQAVFASELWPPEEQRRLIEQHLAGLTSSTKN
jgi:AcrR family transcriptional regulator